ncbi:MAG: Ig-like domain-containing protein [Thermoplasmata archaeon]
MNDGRIKRRIVWEKTGVSEIIGTILMLSITVVLFSGVITMVGSMPSPKQTFTVELKCSLRPVNPEDWTQGVNFIILHQGGQVMDEMWIMIYIAVDDTMLVERVNDGLIDANGDGKWNVGEYWSLLITKVWGEETYVATLGEDSKFSITIVDQERNTLVWQETLGQATHYYAPIIQRAWIDSDVATPVDDPGPISYIDNFIVYAEIRDPNNDLDKGNIWVDMSSIYGSASSPIQLNDTITIDGVVRGHPNDNIYLAFCNPPPRVSVGYYFFTFNASSTTIDPLTNKTLTSQAVFHFPVGMILKDNPQIVVRSDYILFSDNEPTNGDTIRITATIQNLGGVGARVNVTFRIYDENAAMNTEYWIGNTTISVPQVGERDATMEWRASPGGNHTIYVAAWPMDVFELPETENDNTNSSNIIVMPKILLVDDDGHVNDLTDEDTVSFMRASLESADFTYDFMTVGAGDGPSYGVGDYPLKAYDVVIWMTGYKPSPLTSNDIKNLTKFLTGNEWGDRNIGGVGGSLWLISQGFWKEASANTQYMEFAMLYLRDPGESWQTGEMFNGSLPSNLYGNELNNVTDYFATAPIKTLERVPGTDDVSYWLHIKINNTATVALGDLGKPNIPNFVYAMTARSDSVSSSKITDSRILVQTWDFSRIEDTATQSQYAYKAILWLGNITQKFTQDLAISSQTITPEIVFFKQPVTISFTVRNNGFKVYTPGVDRVEYILRIYDRNNYVIKEVYSNLSKVLGAGNENTVVVNISWTPETLGYHRIWIMIDPFNLIPENNKLNNIISNYWGAGELNVQYRVLLVDDDGSENNGGAISVHNETYNMTAALDRLGYTNEAYAVQNSDTGPEYEATTNKPGLNEYNAVIWVGGGSATDPFTSDDVSNIVKYMQIGGNFWYVGTGVDTMVNTTFRSSHLKIASVNVNRGTGDTLMGRNNDQISHGMEFPIANNIYADVLVPVSETYGFTRSSEGFNSVRYSGTAPGGTAPYRVITTSWLLSNLTNEEHRAEFVFMALRWFDKPEERIEARITNADITISNDRPQIGSGYVIRATVHNTGGTTANVLVRFMDGDTQIGSPSVSVSPGGKTSAETIWVPLFAGSRDIRVLVDPLDLDPAKEMGEVDEIFESSNNVAIRTTYVYFFWDDMQSGAGKWSHASTVMHISGEGALEYFHETTLDTAIVDEWNDTQSQHLTTITDPGFYHSFNSAYWLQEPPGGTNGTGGTRGSIQKTETRYMRGEFNEINANGLTAYLLGTTQSITGQSISIENNKDVSTSWGIRAYIRNATTQNEFLLYGGTVAIVTRAAGDTGSGIQWVNYTPSKLYNLNYTDSLVIKVCGDVNTVNPTTVRVIFTTPQLGVSQLDTDTWTVYYYTQRTLATSPTKATGTFQWGTSFYNSRIAGFTTTTVDNTPPTVVKTVPDDGVTGISTSQNVFVTFDEPMNDGATNRPTLIQTAGYDPGGWSFQYWYNETTAVWTHSNWNPLDDITLSLSGAQDLFGNVMVPYEWSFKTASGPTATATGPVGTSNVANITITYNWVGNPDYIWIYYGNSSLNWTFAGNETKVNGTFDGTFPMTLTESGSYWWKAIAQGNGSMQIPPVNGTTLPDTVSPYIFDNVRPTVIAKSPDGVAVPVDAYVVITFTKFINANSVSISITPNPGGLLYLWSDDGTVLTIAHYNFVAETLHTVTIKNALDHANNVLDPIPYSWQFRTAEGGTGGVVDWYGKAPEGNNYNKAAVTESVDLNNLTSAKLSFWHKYNILPGKNGGFLQVGYKVAGVWKWIYVIPSNAYTGNLNPAQTIYDSNNNPVKWCWNGISARGTFGWEYVEMNLLQHVPIANRGDVRMKFNYTQWGNGTGYGWYIDDVRVTVTGGGRDLWEMVKTTDLNNQETTAWYNRDPNPALNNLSVAAGIDNYLMTQPIDLTNARSAFLSALVKFNFNTADGAPPDGFRIEVTSNNGVTWDPINLGVRASWGVSGTGTDDDDGNIDGKSYTGLPEGNYWVDVGTLTRVNTDLSSFSGNVIQIRFRLVTNDHPSYLHYADNTVGFGGFFIDDVTVMGETIMG